MMPVDDLWYLRKRGADGKPIPSKRHGRGKRWRCRWVDPEGGQKREALFHKKSDAERHDANVRADISRGQYVDPASGKITVAEFAEQWRAQQLHRASSAARIETAIRRHIVPQFGSMQLARVRPSHVRSWVKERAEVLGPATLAHVYSGVLTPMFAAAAVDRLIGVSPCTGIRLPTPDAASYTIATPEQVHALYEAMPERYRAIVYVAAACGLRAGEAYGLEVEHVDFLRRELHVQHQVVTLTGRTPFLAPTKTKTSRRTVELPKVAADALARHLEQFPPSPIDVRDETDPRAPVTRPARLLFADQRSGAPLARTNFSDLWRPVARQVGMPKGYGLRDLRHYFATVLIFGGANVKTVQLAMGHTNPTTTLNTYVGYWPDALDRTRSLVDAALGEAAHAASEAQ